MWVFPEDLFVGTSGKTDFNGLAPDQAIRGTVRARHRPQLLRRLVYVESV